MRKSIFLIVMFVLAKLIFATKVHGQNAQNPFSFGGYGEILYQYFDYNPDRFSNPTGAQPDNRSAIGLPRTVFSFDYNFTPNLVLSSEIEFEHGGTGSALELEYEEFGEYEMEIEKAGEVVLEQIHLTKTFNSFFKIRIGHMIIPVGQTNARHESIMYFGTVRPEGETSIIPLTWHETGISVFGGYRRWNSSLFLVNGLDANGFTSAYWIRNGKQGMFEEVKMTDPALAWRLENRSVKNLRLSTSGYYGNSTGNTTKPDKLGHVKGTVTILSGDVEYNNQHLIFRGNIIWGNLNDSYVISSINKTLSKNIQYQRTPVAKNAMTYSAELGYQFNLKNKGSKVIPFVRYEYYNSMQNTASGILADDRYQRDVLTCGINYFLTNEVAIKADFSHRRLNAGKYNSENTFGLALVYTGWFIKSY